MSERLDELKGNVKEGAGKVTGDKDLEAEGSAEQTAAKSKREVKGAASQVKGSIEEGVGKLTGDESTEAQGTADRLKGKAKQAG